MQRLRSISPARLGLLLAAIAFLEQTAEYVFLAQAEGSQLTSALLCVALSACGVGIAYRRPFAGLILAIGALLGQNILLDKATVESTGGPWMTVILLVFWLGLQAEGRGLWIRLAIAYVLMVVQGVTDHYDDSPADYVFGAVILFGAPAAVGQLLRSRSQLAHTLREKADQARRSSEREAEEAVVAERERIATELHDVVAHALGAMTVQAAAARRLAEVDRASAIQAFRAVEDSGRAALAELRRILGVLRREDEDLALAPQPKLAYLSDLVRRTSAAGLPVELSIAGTPPGELPAGVDLTGFRVIQGALREALTTGGAGRAVVKVRYEDSELRLEVRDDGRGSPRSLLGMQERVRVYGGQLRSERARDGGHRVLARLPLEERQ